MLTENGSVSESIDVNKTVTQHPFFVSLAKEGNVINNDNLNQIKDEDKQDLHPEILKLYEMIGYDKEYQYKYYTFLSLNEIIKRKNNYTHIYDIALKYMGLGHVLVISYHLESERFIFRMDGGSNGWDREANYQRYKNFNLTNQDQNYSDEENPTEYIIDKLYTFGQMLNIITSVNTEY